MQNPEENQGKQNVNKWRLASLAMEMGFIIALPLLAFSFLGKWLDNRFQTEPLLTIGGILFAIISTTVWLTRRFKNILKD